MRPLPTAAVDTLGARPGAVIEALRALVTTAGFRVTRSSAAEGYLETGWFDTGVGRAGGTYARDAWRVVRLRFFADSVGNGLVQVVSEAVYRPRLDPSLPARETEHMVPSGHPGDSLLGSVLSDLHARFPRVTP
jgi:hypothetical protein